MRRHYTFVPGCCLDGNGVASGLSLMAIAKVIYLDLIELEDWNCCGSTPQASVSEVASLCHSARNLALAEKKGLDIVTECSDCYLLLNKTNRHFQENTKLKAILDAALATGDLE